MHLYTRPEEPSDRETRIFFVLRAGPNLNGAYGAAGNRTPTAAYEPFRRHGPRGVPSGRGSPSGRGLPRAVASGPTTLERDNPAWFRAWL